VLEEAWLAYPDLLGLFSTGLGAFMVQAKLSRTKLDDEI
jgi:hypothetical protein